MSHNAFTNFFLRSLLYDMKSGKFFFVLAMWNVLNSFSYFRLSFSYYSKAGVREEKLFFIARHSSLSSFCCHVNLTKKYFPSKKIKLNHNYRWKQISISSINFLPFHTFGARLKILSHQSLLLPSFENTHIYVVHFLFFFIVSHPKMTHHTWVNNKKEMKSMCAFHFDW